MPETPYSDIATKRANFVHGLTNEELIADADKYGISSSDPQPVSYSAVPGDDRCECVDANDGHPHGLGDNRQCTRKAISTLWRVDTEDVNGTRFCDECAGDAMGSGLYTDEAGDADDDTDGDDPHGYVNDPNVLTR